MGTDQLLRHSVFACLCFSSGFGDVNGRNVETCCNRMRRCSLAVARHWLLPEDHGHGLVHLREFCLGCSRAAASSRGEDAQRSQVGIVFLFVCLFVCVSLAVDFPFFSAIVLFNNQPFFQGLPEKRIPGKNGEATPRSVSL